MQNYQFVECLPNDSIFGEVAKLLYVDNSLRINQKENIQLDCLHKCFVLLKDNVPVGRFAIYNNTLLYHQNLKASCIGNYECENDLITSKTLLDKAYQECKLLNAEYIIGPMNGSTWYDYRFRLNDNKDLFTTEAFHHNYYSNQFENYGFSSIANYISAKDEQLITNTESVINRKVYFEEQNITIRPINLNKFEEEMKTLFDFCVKAFKNNFLFTTISFQDFFSKYKPLQQLFNPKHILIAEDNNEVVGLLFCIDNFNNKASKELIVKTLAVKEGIRYAGLGKVLLNEIILNAKQDYTSIIHAFIIEGGTSANVSKNLSGEVFQRYSLYGMPIKLEDTESSAKNNIVNYFFEASKQFPEKKAIQYLDKSINFGNLKKEVDNYSAYLKSKGIEKGDRILVFVPMSIELYTVVLAIFNIGATAVFIDEWASIKRLKLCCKIADCKGIVAPKKLLFIGLLFNEIRKIPIKLDVSTDIISDESLSESVLESDTALITFTTGSTGIPKAANRTHQFLNAQYQVLKEHTKANAEDTELTTLPIVLLMNLGIGSTSVIADFNQKKPEKLKPEIVIQQILDHKITKITASPYFVEKLALYINKNNTYTSIVKKVFTGGAPVFPNMANTICRAFEDSEVEIIYGSTESEPISSVNAKQLINQNTLDDGGLLVGRVDKNTEVLIIPIINTPIILQNKSISKIELPKGKIGEISVSGKHVLKNYFRNEDAFNQNKIIDKDTIWHRTGDSGFIGNDGLLYLTGRCSNLINLDDKIISPFIAEYQISQIEGIKCGTVIFKNEKIIAIIEIADKQKPKEVLFKTLKNLIPEIEEIKIVSRIPRDPRHFSKIDYQKLLGAS
ncbi:MAG: GNAT family N-acetyltransferase [Bacteroidota bacterium]